MARPPAGFERLAATELGETTPAIRKLAKRLPFDVADLDGHSVWVATRSITVDTLRIPRNTTVLIDGKLKIDGLLDDRPLWADPDNMRHLIVAGDVSAGSILLGSHAFIGGSLRVDGWLVAESDGDYELRVRGDLKASGIIALGHHVKVHGKTTAGYKIGFLGLASDVDDKDEMGAAFVAGVRTRDGGLDLNKVVKRLLAGAPILLRDER